MSNSPIKMPFELKELCEQSLSHMQLSAACGDAEGAARQAERLIDIARSLRDAFLPADHPRCDQCAEPLSNIEAQSGEHCRQCSLLMSMGAQIEKIRLKNLAAPQPQAPENASTTGSSVAAGCSPQAPVAAGCSPLVDTPSAAPKPEPKQQPVQKAAPQPVQKAAPQPVQKAAPQPVQKAAPQPVPKEPEAKSIKGRKQPAAKTPPAKKAARPESIQLELAVR